MNKSKYQKPYKYELSNVEINGKVVAVRMTITQGEFKISKQFLVSEYGAQEVRNVAMDYFRMVKFDGLSVKKLSENKLMEVAEDVVTKQRQRTARLEQLRNQCSKDVAMALAQYTGTTTIFAYRNVFGEWVA